MSVFLSPTSEILNFPFFLSSLSLVWMLTRAKEKSGTLNFSYSFSKVPLPAMLLAVCHVDDLYATLTQMPKLCPLFFFFTRISPKNWWSFQLACHGGFLLNSNKIVLELHKTSYLTIYPTEESKWPTMESSSKSFWGNSEGVINLFLRTASFYVPDKASHSSGCA